MEKRKILHLCKVIPAFQRFLRKINNCSSGEGNPNIYYSDNMLRRYRLYDTNEVHSQLREEMIKLNPDDYVTLNYSYFEEAFKKKKEFKEMFNPYSNKGLCLNVLDNNILFKFMNFVKEDKRMSFDFFNEILQLNELGNSDVIKLAFDKENNSFIKKLKAKAFCEKYENIINLFDKSESEKFINNLESYMAFMFYVLKDLSISLSDDIHDNKILNQITDNLNKINELDLDNVYLNFYPNVLRIGTDVDLHYCPLGEINYEYSSIIYYKEENLYTDGGTPSVKYPQGEDCARVFVHNPRYILKGSRTVGFSPEKGGDFDLKKWDMLIYDLIFDLRLPTKDMLNNTESSLEGYQDFIYNKKLDLFKKQLSELKSIYEELNKKFKSIEDLANDIDIMNIIKAKYGDRFAALDDMDYALLEMAMDSQRNAFTYEKIKPHVLKKKK